MKIYDPENRMTAFGTLMSAGYRADNLRAWKQNSVGARTYFYYVGGTPLFETDATGAVTATNVFSPDGLTARKQGGSWIYYTFDQQGNVAQRLKAFSNVKMKVAGATGLEPAACGVGDRCSTN